MDIIKSTAAKTLVSKKRQNFKIDSLQFPYTTNRSAQAGA